MGVVPWQASRYAGLGLGMLASKILQRPWLLEAPRLQVVARLRFQPQARLTAHRSPAAVQTSVRLLDLTPHMFAE